MNKRIFELDVLRGLSIALMIIVDAPPDAMYEILQHAAWEGFNLADTIFPAFVFAMGMAAATFNKKNFPSCKDFYK